MPAPLIVVDNFLSAQDADSLCDPAPGLTDPDLQGALPGRNSLECIHVPALVPVVSQLVGGPLRPINAHAKSASSVPVTRSQGCVHIDSPVEWSGSL